MIPTLTFGRTRHQSHKQFSVQQHFGIHYKRMWMPQLKTGALVKVKS